MQRQRVGDGVAGFDRAAVDTCVVVDEGFLQHKNRRGVDLEAGGIRRGRNRGIVRDEGSNDARACETALHVEDGGVVKGRGQAHQNLTLHANAWRHSAHVEGERGARHGAAHPINDDKSRREREGDDDVGGGGAPAVGHDQAVLDRVPRRRYGDHGRARTEGFEGRHREIRRRHHLHAGGVEQGGGGGVVGQEGRARDSDLDRSRPSLVADDGAVVERAANQAAETQGGRGVDGDACHIPGDGVGGEHTTIESNHTLEVRIDHVGDRDSAGVAIAGVLHADGPGEGVSRFRGGGVGVDDGLYNHEPRVTGHCEAGGVIRDDGGGVVGDHVGLGGSADDRLI